MKIKEMFQKVAAYNELAEIMKTEKAHVWFAHKIGGTSIKDGYTFQDWGEFRKYIRKEYFPDVADVILNNDEWQINSIRSLVNGSGRELWFELYIEAD